MSVRFGGDSSIGTHESDPERELLIHAQFRDCAGYRAEGIGDDHQYLAELARLHIRDNEHPVCRQRQVGGIELPLVSQRFSAGNRNGKCGGVARQNRLILRLRVNHRRLRVELPGAERQQQEKTECREKAEARQASHRQQLFHAKSCQN